MKLRNLWNFKLWAEILMQKNIIKVSDETYLKFLYKNRYHKELNLENPQTFNEKMQWLKLYNRKPEYTNMVDKYEVKKYVEEKIGKEYIIPTLGIWDKFEEINFETLPNEFVLKPTHTSGNIFICKDKQKINYEKLKKEVRKWLKRNYYYTGREWPYKNIKPRIIAEQYMVDESKEELKDYKVFCFHGIPKFIEVDFGRFTQHKRNIYSLDWRLLDLRIKYPTDPSASIKKPEGLETIVKVAKILSENIPFVRVDMYSINKDIYFGELTFFHDSGFDDFEPEEWNQKMGDMLVLPGQKVEEKNKII